MIEILLLPKVGSFAENKDTARDIRLNEILPALQEQQTVVLNFEGVDSTTQSFIHALISDVLRKYGSEILDRLQFKHCSPTVKEIVSIVVEYMQQS
ncbi:MAG: STAS-like domain-containing protein [Patescibacteria group bacterium]|jgi:hypothetical protein